MDQFWTKGVWFALAELASSHVWLVVHSIYGPRASALYTSLVPRPVARLTVYQLLRVVAGGMTSNLFACAARAYLPTLNLLLTPMINNI